MMRSFLKAAVVWQAAISSAFHIPSWKDKVSPANDILTVAGSTGPDQVSIQFQSPCPTYLGFNEDLDIELSIPSADEACTLQGVQVNGVPLISSWYLGKVGKGRGTFEAKLSHGLGEREIYASWRSTCLKDEATLLSFKIHGPTGEKDVTGSTGFTISFNQRDQPTVLRLQSGFINISEGDDFDEAWLGRDETQRVVILNTDSIVELDPPQGPQAGPPGILQEEYQRLEELKVRMFEIGREVHLQEGKIFHMLRQDFKTCEGMRCLLQTAVRKIPDFTKFVMTHFRHHPRPDHWKSGQPHFNCSRGLPGFEMDDREELDTAPAMMEVSPPQADAPFEPDHPHPPFKPDHPHPPFEPDHPRPPFEPDHPHPPFEPHHPHPPFDGPPPFGKDHPHPPFDGPPPFGKDHPHPPGDHTHPPFNGPPPPPGGPSHHGPPPFPHPHHRHHHGQLIKGVIAMGVIAIAMSYLFRYVRRNTALFRNDRRAADRASCREERRNRRAYRSAARKHQWAQWWNRYRRPFSSGDYEEKRALIIEQEGVLEDAMQGEIRSLRTAQEIVGEMVRAEEGRARLYYQANLPPFRQRMSVAELEAGVGSSRTTNGLPTYHAPPPQYEEELEGDITVVDGFQYTPSASSDETPDSSVVDCSPRLSFETGRTTLTKEPRD